MLENVEGNQPNTNETPIIDTSHELKWKRTYRKRLINCLALICDNIFPKKYDFYCNNVVIAEKTN